MGLPTLIPGNGAHHLQVIYVSVSTSASDAERLSLLRLKLEAGRPEPAAAPVRGDAPTSPGISSDDCAGERTGWYAMASTTPTTAKLFRLSGLETGPIVDVPHQEVPKFVLKFSGVFLIPSVELPRFYQF
jgi:hypothetical protein